MVAESNNKENSKDLLWLWDIKESLKNFIETIKDELLTSIGLKEKKEKEKQEEATKQEENELKDEIKDTQEEETEKTEEKEENKKQKKATKQEKNESKNGIKKEVREKKWKFTISAGILPSESNARFWLNWTNNDAIIILNWPLFAPGWKPVWWYIENWYVKKTFNTKVNEKASWNFYYNNWIFWYWTDWKMHMFSFKEIEKQDWATITKKNWETITFKRAMQNWPMLVANGKEWTTSQKKKTDRTAIWFTSTGEIRAIQWKWITLWELATFCKNEWLTNAIYLDGSPWIAWLKNWKTWEKRWWFASWATWLQLW